MWSLPVIVLTPFFDFFPGIIQRQKPALVQAFLPETPIESLNQSIVRRLTGTYEIQLYPIQICPLIQYLRSEFGPLSTLIDFGDSLFLNYLH